MTWPPALRLDGKVALVTGGSRGLGRHIAGAFSAAGATVVVASRKLDACEEAAREITDQTGQPAVGLACHVGRWRDCDRLADTVLSQFGQVDVLVNNAGSSPQYEALHDVTEALFDKVLAVNLRGAFRLSARLGPEMVRAGGGSIINISSIAAERPSPTELPYAAAKAGLDALTTGFAKAYAPTVRVNSIVPGMFATDISAAWDPETVMHVTRTQIPLGRIGEPSEIVGAALYLASDASSFTTGTRLRVDGGQTA